MAAIGPTAQYTGRVWARHGLSHPELDSFTGRVLHAATAPTMLASQILGGPTLDDFLLARHLVIDALLEDEIAEGRVGQVLEVACGMSPRGWRFTERHDDLVYVEADLPDMAAAKRAALERIGRPARHRVVELDALDPDGPLSLDAVAAGLDPDRGLAIITEGLLSYLPREAVLGLWARFAATLDRFPSGLYLSDLHVDSDTATPLARAFEAALSAFVRTPVAVHFSTAKEAERALLDAGFSSARVERASEHPVAASRRGADLVRIVRAWGSPTAS
jgi:O-methyltransferase involved in polyketide biosynthesis